MEQKELEREELFEKEDSAEQELLYDKEPMRSAELEDEEEEADNLLLVFHKPYLFEGREYNELDLHCLEDVKGKDLNAASKYLTKKGVTSALPEMEMMYAQVLASRMTKMPIEFFLRMPGRESIKLKNIVTGFLFAGDGAD